MATRVQPNRFGDRVMCVAEAAYLAGLFDGEGSLYLAARKDQGRRSHHFNPEMNMGNTDLALLESVVAITGNGAIYLDRPSGPNSKPGYRWLLQPSQMRHILPQILPFLRGKKRRAELMLEFFDLQKQADRGPWGYTKPEVIDRILAVYAELRLLNQRGLIPAEKLDFELREPKERKRTCDEEGCESRRYRGHEYCYSHWLQRSERIPKTCERCGSEFLAILPHARFCSKKCQWRTSYERRKEVLSGGSSP